MLIDAIAARIRQSAMLRNIPVRVHRDEPDDPEQIIVSETQGQADLLAQAPMWTPQFTVHARALTHRRASEICKCACLSLANYIPDSGDEYVHGTPSLEMAPGYISDDDRERPVYGFTFTYTVTPREYVK
jgi:hypothetical protein